ncbi:Riboflavin biosynthesis protein ribF [Bacteroidales bacterium Barb6XT]|nr:Riboflavin biosynthesis protein ribF [Bacteroidales bacterium Barb6XT]
MIVIRDAEVLKGKELAATVGFFDGVHVGHRFLIRALQEAARVRRLPVAVITFPRHPREVLQAGYQPKLLNSFEEKLVHLEETGIDYCIVTDFTVGLSQLSAQAYIHSVLAEQLHVKTLLAGYDHRFGHNRRDGLDEYIVYGKACGIEVLSAAACGTDGEAVSSSVIRRLLATGRVEETACLLTYPYQLKGHIKDGYKIGRKLGFPTANIETDEPFKIIPSVGIYAVRVTLEGKSYRGMLCIGNRPTLNNGSNITIEVHILDFSGDIYNSELTVSFIRYIRDTIKFDTLDDLAAQLERDKETTRKLLIDNDE